MTDSNITSGYSLTPTNCLCCCGDNTSAQKCNPKNGFIAAAVAGFVVAYFGLILLAGHALPVAGTESTALALQQFKDLTLAIAEALGSDLVTLGICSTFIGGTAVVASIWFGRHINQQHAQMFNQQVII